jgi:hypothetical protein
MSATKQFFRNWQPRPGIAERQVKVQTSTTMPRYYFHVGNGTKVLDKEGSELLDKQEAHKAAVHLAVDIARLNLGFGGWVRSGHVVVTDENGDEVLKVPLPTKP